MTLTPEQEQLKRDLQQWVSDAAAAPARQALDAALNADRVTLDAAEAMAHATYDNLAAELKALAERVVRLEGEIEERRKPPCSPSKN